MSTTKRRSHSTYTRVLNPRLVAFAVLIALAAATLASCGSDDGSSSGEEAVRFGTFSTGLGSVLVQHVAESGLDDKAGVEVEVVSYDNLQAMYADLLSGRIDANIAGADTYASMALKEAPVQVVAAVAEDSTAMLGRGQPITSGEQLKGKRIAAITSGGSWPVFSRLMEERFGVTEGDDYEVVNVTNVQTGAAQVLSGTADYAVGWEPSTTQVLLDSPDLSSVLSVKDLIDTTWLLSMAVRRDLDADSVESLVSAFNQGAEQLAGDAEQADAVGVEVGYETDVIKTMFDNGTSGLDVQPLTASIIEQMTARLELVGMDAGALPDDFFVEGIASEAR
jgi:ABC-type nitrate/sulfonate/bicarbonate transport system substrate-binding protein